MTTYRVIKQNFTSKMTLLKILITSTNIMEASPMICNIFNRPIAMLITWVDLDFNRPADSKTECLLPFETKQWVEEVEAIQAGVTWIEGLVGNWVIRAFPTSYKTYVACHHRLGRSQRILDWAIAMEKLLRSSILAAGEDQTTSFLLHLWTAQMSTWDRVSYTGAILHLKDKAAHLVVSMPITNRVNRIRLKLQ
jgi:hypothetical protein